MAKDTNRADYRQRALQAPGPYDCPSQNNVDAARAILFHRRMRRNRCTQKALNTDGHTRGPGEESLEHRAGGLTQ